MSIFATKFIYFKETLVSSPSSPKTLQDLSFSTTESQAIPSSWTVSIHKDRSKTDNGIIFLNKYYLYLIQSATQPIETGLFFEFCCLAGYDLVDGIIIIITAHGDIIRLGLGVRSQEFMKYLVIII